MSVFEEEKSLFQDGEYRKHLNRNWQAGNKKLSELESKLDKLKPAKQSTEIPQNSIDELNARINRIVLGIDHDTIKLVVREILKEEGVI